MRIAFSIAENIVHHEAKLEPGTKVSEFWEDTSPRVFLSPRVVSKMISLKLSMTKKEKVHHGS